LTIHDFTDPSFLISRCPGSCFSLNKRQNGDGTGF
jgi:hypothetical protein